MTNDHPTIELSERELQVLQLVVTGASNLEIAHRLVISPNTVKVHLRNIFSKLDVQSRTEATSRAIQEGLVTLTEPKTQPAEAEEISPPAVKSYLMEAAPPPVLPRWQQLYLTFAFLLALGLGTLPLLPTEATTLTPNLLPPIILQSPTPVPPVTASRWANHASMSGPRAGLALIAFDRQLFAIGGIKDNNKTTRLVEIYDPTTNSWAEGASKPTAAAHVSAAILDDKIYIPGGCTDQAQAFEILEIYDPKTDHWADGPSLPEARCGYGLVAFEDKLYLFGGWNGQAFENTIFIFSLDEAKWERSKQSMPQPLGYMGVAALEETIYVVGGYDGRTEFDTTYAFTPATGAWQEKAVLNEKRGGLGLVSSNKNLYAIGGGWEHALSSSEKYDPATDTWTPFETPSASRWRNLGLTIVDTTIYAVGGWDGAEKTFMDQVVSYQFLYEIFLPYSIKQGQPTEE